MEYVKTIIDIMQAFLIFCNVCIMLYVFKGFVSKPHNSLEQEVTEIKVKVKDIEDSLKQGNDKFREQNETNETMDAGHHPYILWPYGAQFVFE